MGGGDGEEGSERGVPGAAPVEAEDELVEIGLEVVAAQAVVDPQGPDLEVGEDAMDPGQDDMGGHPADDMGIVGEARGAGIAGPSVGLGGGTGGEVGGEEGVQAAGRVIGHLAQPNAAGPSTPVLDFDGADDKDLALVAATATARQWIIFAAAGNLGFINLNEAGQQAAVRGEHAAAQLGAEQPRRLVGTESELTLQLQRRDPVGVGGHQIGGPEPSSQRQLGVMQDGSGSDRSLAAAAGALECPGLGFQPPGFATTATRANEPVRPTHRDQILRASRLVAEALLELD